MKKILPLLCLLVTTSNAFGQAAEWTQGIAQGVSTILDIHDRLAPAPADCDGSTQVTLKSYMFETTLDYPMSNQHYYQRWYAWEGPGGWNYSYVFVYNGTVIGSSTAPFEIGLSSGMPMTKRNWVCYRNDASVNFSMRSTSMMILKVKHTIIRSCNNPQPWVNVVVYCGGSQLEAFCGDAIGVPSAFTFTKQVGRGQASEYTYNRENHVLEDIWGRPN